jgi:archaellum component FlaC
MPNPKKEHGDKKTHNMKVLLDDAQYALVQSAANAAGMKMAAYMRNQAIYGKIEIHNHIVANFSSLERISAELSSISNNLNQLTTYFHTGGVKSESMQEELRRCINEVMKMREELLAFGGEYRGYIKTSGK